MPVGSVSATPALSADQIRAKVEPVVWVERRSPSDGLGRCQFFLYWFQAYIPGAPHLHMRGQVFHASIADHVPWPGRPVVRSRNADPAGFEAWKTLCNAWSPEVAS